MEENLNLPGAETIKPDRFREIYRGYLIKHYPNAFKISTFPGWFLSVKNAKKEIDNYADKWGEGKEV